MRKTAIYVARVLFAKMEITDKKRRIKPYFLYEEKHKAIARAKE